MTTKYDKPYNRIIMKTLVSMFLLFMATEALLPPTFNLPPGAELVLPGKFQPGFSCEGRLYGYYADLKNDCHVFHVCIPLTDERGNENILQYTFKCKNKTAFNQEFLICDQKDNVDCSKAPSFYVKKINFNKMS